MSGSSAVASPKRDDEGIQRFENIDYVIVEEAAGTISKDEASRRLDEAWSRAYRLSVWERLLIALFPSVFARKVK